MLTTVTTALCTPDGGIAAMTKIGDDGAGLVSIGQLAKAAGVSVLDGPYMSSGRNIVMVQFPGGYISEIHSSLKAAR